MSELDQYDYELPRELIAQYPLVRRCDARLMVIDRRSGEIDHRYVRDLPELLAANDCLVLNDTRVIAARLEGRRTSTGGHWEGLFLEEGPRGLWHVLGKTRGHLHAGDRIELTDTSGAPSLTLELAARLDDGGWAARPLSPEPTFSLLERVGRVPLPPYIRKGEMVDSDRERYQTVYASKPGAVAAPTAGLHFTDRLLEQISARGATIVRVTLHVGLGTFRPITAERLEDHALHSEVGTVGEEAVAKISACRTRGGRVVAVGTTSLRVLETAALGGALQPFHGATDLFIRPPFRFRAVDVLMTNFHLPRSTLLVLVRTFGGDALLRRAYDEAIAERYRFYSYGDAMLIV